MPCIFGVKIQMSMQCAIGNSMVNRLLFNVQSCLSIDNAIWKWQFNIQSLAIQWSILYENWQNNEYWIYICILHCQVWTLNSKIWNIEILFAYCIAIWIKSTSCFHSLLRFRIHLLFLFSLTSNASIEESNTICF